jgi:hypothetical protein
MKPVATWAILAAAVVLAGCAAQAPVSESGGNVNQILLGSWTPAQPKPGGCLHTIDFSAASVVTITSGAAQIVGRYRLADRANARGLYRMQITLISEKPGRDCDGGENTEPGVAGDSADLGYIWVDPAKDVFMLCEEDSFSFCGVPMRRVR